MDLFKQRLFRFIITFYNFNHNIYEDFHYFYKSDFEISI